MRSKFFIVPKLTIILLLFFLSVSALHAATIVVWIRACPERLVTAVPESALRILSDQLESMLMDYYFDAGHIVTSLPPLLLHKPEGLKPTNAELASALWQADTAKAYMLVSVSVESGAPDFAGKVKAQTIRLQAHFTKGPSQSAVKEIVVGQADPRTLYTQISKHLSEISKP